MGNRVAMRRYMKAMRSYLLPLVLAPLAVACGSSSSPSGFGTNDDAGGTPGNDAAAPDIDGSAPSFGDGATVDAGANAKCPIETQYVYTVASDDTLYKFDPPSLTFTSIGKLTCSNSASPYSMAVARDGTAYVLYDNGKLFKVDTKTAGCTSTSFSVSQHGFYTFGMGFSTDTSGGTSETLYVSDSGQGPAGSTHPIQGLATIDVGTLKLTPVNGYDAIDARAEMTGTGDARLFGAFEGSPYVVAEIEKSDAKILSQAPQNAINYSPGSSNFAFAFWGGDFWLFVGPGTKTDVFHYVPSTKQTTKVKSVNFAIVGAGVSTCAPTSPPK